MLAPNVPILTILNYFPPYKKYNAWILYFNPNRRILLPQVTYYGVNELLVESVKYGMQVKFEQKQNTWKTKSNKNTFFN